MKAPELPAAFGSYLSDVSDRSLPNLSAELWLLSLKRTSMLRLHLNGKRSFYGVRFASGYRRDCHSSVEIVLSKVLVFSTGHLHRIAVWTDGSPKASACEQLEIASVRIFQSSTLR